ncbi:MAG: carbamoyltransferase HypF [Bacteroidales bacterium]|nr:carbamoyltransferase HypF [Bacteroidales bacterium]MDT8374127.1 carbamoyltransferase HypF [Bacteroidales bacterium]
MVRGLVQGVGFRPFIRRLAIKHNLTGEVVNRTGGVTVVIECDRERADMFARDIQDLAPPAAVVRSVQLRKTRTAGFTGFSIRPSLDADETITEVSPDIAVCRECLDDLVTDPGRRGYPFINCTNCGPRFTIIKSLPYDRINTTMAAFEMCHRCAAEYMDISDRRFHAQPVACNSCGPVYTLRAGDLVITSINDILEEIALRLASGGSVAIKSTGGYNIMCDALNEAAVAGLRQRKQRDSKPFAVMFRDINAVHEYCHVEVQEKAMLESWRRPVVILQQKMPLAPSVSSGLNTTGAMLPHMPVHYLLFRLITTPVLVLTSGNLSDEPIITLDSKAERDLMPVTGCIVSYNREINNRADDSVVRVINGNISLIRRSRGYAPEPVDLSCSVEGVFAAGAEQKNSFCIGRGSQAFMSQYIGDLVNLSTYDFYLDSLRLFSSLFRFTPSHVACDMHPDYLSGRFAEEMAEQNGVPLVRVQHHHAHAASVMAEHRLIGEVIGVIMDGTGYGTDGNIWGSEFMIATPADFERYTHFDYFMMPGGDIAADEPWRMALSCLFRYFGSDYDFSSLELFRQVEGRKLETVRQMLVNGINSPLTCGAGRIFDAVSALLLLCTESKFDAEAPMRLESAASSNIDEYYPYSLNGTVSLQAMFAEMLKELEHPDVPGIAARFHNTVAHIILDVCLRIRRETGLKRVVLSGGVFQNRYLLEKSLYLLSMNKFRVYTNHLVPANDGGVSLGQLLVAAERRGKCV